MKIISIENDPEPIEKNQSDMDLLGVVVEYNNGVIAVVYMYRARFKRIKYQQYLVNKYGMDDSELETLSELLEDEYRSDHFYDNEE